MKRILLSMLAGVMTLAAGAQSTNPLNYSGTMYVESITVIETPRYISYEDHAILTEQMTIPSVEVTKIVMDFENNTLTLKNDVSKIKVNDCKKYDTNHGWEVVIYCEDIKGGKIELVWREHGKPYLQAISKTESGTTIAKMILSSKPVASSPEDAMMGLFQGLGDF